MFTVHQAVAEGWTVRQVRRRRESGEWVTVAGIGLAAAGRVPTAQMLGRSARLTWPDCTVSHLTAAALHGFPVDAGSHAHVITGRGRCSGRQLIVHAVPLPAGHVTSLRGIRLTAAPRTAIDALCQLSPGSALDLWAWLVTRGVLTLDDLDLAIRLRGGRPGVRGLAELRRSVRSGATSQAELRAHRLLVAVGITGWQAGVTVRDGDGVIGVVDILFAAQRVVVEIDGYRAHRDRARFLADRRRQNRLVAAGYIVLRYTWDDLVDRPRQVIAEILAATATEANEA